MGQREVQNWLRSGAREVVPMRYPGEYVFPGGGAESGETPEQAARRELGEELRVPVPADAKLRLLTVKQTRPVRFRSDLVYVYAACTDENPWLARLDIGSVNGRLRRRRAQCELLCSSGRFWSLPVRERQQIAPELNSVRWLPISDAVCNAFTSMNITPTPVNAFQRADLPALVCRGATPCSSPLPCCSPPTRCPHMKPSRGILCRREGRRRCSQRGSGCMTA